MLYYFTHSGSDYCFTVSNKRTWIIWAIFCCCFKFLCNCCMPGYHEKVWYFTQCYYNSKQTCPCLLCTNCSVQFPVAQVTDVVKKKKSLPLNMESNSCISYELKHTRGPTSTPPHTHTPLPVAAAGAVNRPDWSPHWCLHWTHPLCLPLHQIGCLGCWLHFGWTVLFEWSQRLIPPSSLAPMWKDVKGGRSVSSDHNRFSKMLTGLNKHNWKIDKYTAWDCVCLSNI